MTSILTSIVLSSPSVHVTTEGDDAEIIVNCYGLSDNQNDGAPKKSIEEQDFTSSTEESGHKLVLRSINEDDISNSSQDAIRLSQPSLHAKNSKIFDKKLEKTSILGDTSEDRNEFDTAVPYSSDNTTLSTNSPTDETKPIVLNIQEESVAILGPGTLVGVQNTKIFSPQCLKLTMDESSIDSTVRNLNIDVNGGLEIKPNWLQPSGTLEALTISAFRGISSEDTSDELCPLLPKGLRYLNITNTPVVSMSLCSCPAGINSLILQNCDLTSLKICPHWVSLTELRVSQNLLEESPGPLPESLRILDLSHNKISSLPVLSQHIEVSIYAKFSLNFYYYH